MANWRYLLFIGIMLFCYRTHAETIEIGAENDWIPYSKADGTGMANDIVKAAYASVGINVKLVIQPYTRLLKLVEAGELLGAFNVPKDTEITSRFLLGKEALYIAHSDYYQNTHKPLGAKNRNELHNAHIAVVSNYGYGNHYLQSVATKQIIPVTTHAETLNLKMLAAGRVDGTILYSKTANILLKQLNLTGQIERAFENESIPIYLAFSRKSPRRSQWYADKLDAGLANIKASGEYQKIIDSY